MAAPDGQMNSRPLAIAPTPASTSTSSTDLDKNGHSPQSTMRYTCQACAKRKVKCDKLAGTCSSCCKSKLECIYLAPPPRRRKRKLSDDDDERLARYERILHQHGLLPQDARPSTFIEEIPREPIPPRYNEPATSGMVKLVVDQGKSRYIGGDLWRTLGDYAMQCMSDDDEEEGRETTVASGTLQSDPLTGAFIGSEQILLHYHPTHVEAMMLWKTHVERVEPLCKILHIPSTFKMLETTSLQPETASKADECLLFAIYHFAVFSMTEEECAKILRQPRSAAMNTYNFATRQALVNASFLKTTEMSILQALVLFLLPGRHFYDPHTYWILTGVAVRLAQRLGIHQDGDKMNLPPFETHLRRRLFYQVLPLDGVAGQISGTGIAIIPDAWDTKQPLNINDDQIRPGITEPPKEFKGATEMIFCLTRSCLGKYLVSIGNSKRSGEFESCNYIERVIGEAESEVEEKYIRYCDVVNPLHFLTMGLARAAITAMRMKIRLSKVRKQTATDEERRQLFQLSQKIIDTDTAAYSHPGLKKYAWFMKSFFVWGSWDSILFILTNLGRPGLLSLTENDNIWDSVEQIYENHSELLDSTRALHIAIGRLTLKAWDANPPSSNTPEPAFITGVRSLRKASLKSGMQKQVSSTISPASGADAIAPINLDANAQFGGFSDDTGVELPDNFDVDDIDWTFWDQLIHDYQAQGA